ncbi:MAG: GGDEF domain-containing protein [Campylobacter sp.]|uniref:GGDEF domain-containing protein n=1 Tax=Campylobacter sp. TaxID=205 RepID=UPI003FA0F534
MIKLDNKKSENVVVKKEDEKAVEAVESEFNIYGFSEAIIKELTEENIPSIPKNYTAFFEKMLEKQPDDFKKKVGEIIKIEEEISRLEDDRQINIEREVKNSFMQIKSMLQAVGLIYKNLTILRTIIKKRSSILEPNISLLSLQNMFNAFNEDLNRLNSLMNKHIEVIKTSYEEVSKVFKVVEEQSIYDPKFDIYNRKFFLKTLETEVGNIEKYGYESSVMLIKPKEAALKDIGSKGRLALLKNISRMLLRTSKRSDILAHYGGGCFAMLMRHTDMVGAQKACERITEMFYETSFILKGEKFEFDMEVVACNLRTDKTVTELLSAALDTLVKTGRDGKRYEILDEKAAK